QSPDQVTIDRPERKLLCLRLTARIRHVIQDPYELACGEIGIDPEAGVLDNQRFQTFFDQLAAVRRRAAVLPHDRGIDAFARRALPDQRRLTLVRDAERCEFLRRHPAVRDHLFHHFEDRLPYFLRVVFHPTGLRIELRELLLRGRYRSGPSIENDGTAAAGALVDREEVVNRHRAPGWPRSALRFSSVFRLPVGQSLPAGAR